MLLSAILALSISAASTASGGAGHAKLPWFEGSFEQLLAKAEAEDKIIFIDFWTDWCHWCKQLEKDTLSSGPVITAMGDMLCYSVDAESAAGRPLAGRFGVGEFPTMLFLNPDGKLRDDLDGYFPPDSFVDQIARIERDEGTLNDLRREVDDAADETGVLYELILRLESHSAEEAALWRARLSRQDPVGTTPSSRRFTLDRIIKSLETNLRLNVEAAEQPLVEFLATETLPSILFRGHSVLVRVYRFQAQVNPTADKATLRSKELLSNRLTWQHCPAVDRVRVGNSIAWEIWNLSAQVTPEYRAFALDVAGESARLSGGEDPSVLETLACCLHMNGQRQAAVETMDRCIELDPGNQAWEKRRSQLIQLATGS